MWKRPTRHKIICFKCNSTLTTDTCINWITDYFISAWEIAMIFFFILNFAMKDVNVTCSYPLTRITSITVSNAVFPVRNA